jgi:hypothetical protein
VSGGVGLIPIDSRLQRRDVTAARIDDASRPAGASRNHDTRRLHAIAPGLVGQTIERAGGYKQDAAPPGRRQDLDA